MTNLVDEKRLEELRKSWDASGQDVHFFSRADFEYLAETLSLAGEGGSK